MSSPIKYKKLPIMNVGDMYSEYTIPGCSTERFIIFFQTTVQEIMENNYPNYPK
jgi:hypothetical protein